MKRSPFFLLALWALALAGMSLFSACHSEPIVVQLSDDGSNGNGGNNNGGNNNGGNNNANECPEGTVSFQYEVLPLLVSSCATSGCHDAASHKEGVIMDSYENIIKKVKPNKPPSKSKLYQVLVRSGGERMPPPPNPAFTQEQINLIVDWIDQGAPNNDCLPACNPLNYTFSAVIFPTIQQSCTGCHSGSQPSGNIWLENYDDIYLYAVNGKLLGTIKHQAGYSSMPPGVQLDDCRIAQIENWINNGAPND